MHSDKRDHLIKLRRGVAPRHEAVTSLSHLLPTPDATADLSAARHARYFTADRVGRSVYKHRPVI
jgi:hypothetical protein